MSPRQPKKTSRCLPIVIALASTLAPACVDGDYDVDQSDTADILGDGLEDLVNISGANIEDQAVYTSNEEAFAAKLRVIDAAKAGDSIDITYYILADDESSSMMASRMIAATRRGVKIRVILDYITNISRVKYYSWIQHFATTRDSCDNAFSVNPGCDGTDYVDGGSMEFSFYNPPSASVQEQFRFMVTPCSIEGDAIVSDACTADRHANKNSVESFQRGWLLQSGLFGGNSSATQEALGPVVAQYEAVAAAGTGDTDTEELTEALRLLYRAKVKGEVGASIAVFFLADRLAPLTAGLASLNAFGLDDEREFEHLSDFTHQKLTLLTPGNASEPTQLVLGGRNIENSYNLSALPSTGTYSTDLSKYAQTRKYWANKYSFLDVDYYAKFTGSGKNTVQARFDRLWDFDAMVVPLGDKRLGINTSAEVAGKPVFDDYSADYLKQGVERFQSSFNYQGGTVAPVNPSASWAKTQAVAKTQLPTISDFQVDQAYYVENIPNPQAQTRSFGTTGWDTEAASGKGIHAVWHKALANVCASTGTPKEVVIHNAYLLLPTHFQYALHKAVTKKETCLGVSKFTIATNSRESTDLNIINIFNESYIKPLLDEAPEERLEYYEYNTDKITDQNPVSRSLHAKVMIFGDDIFIGSANADGRSKFMDSNNGIYLQGAANLVEAYKAWLGATALPALAQLDPHKIKATSADALRADNLEFFDTQILQRWFGGRDTVGANLKTRVDVLTKQLSVIDWNAKPSKNVDMFISLDQRLELL